MKLLIIEGTKPSERLCLEITKMSTKLAKSKEVNESDDILRRTFLHIHDVHF